jgi:hypothetical protein
MATLEESVVDIEITKNVLLFKDKKLFNECLPILSAEDKIILNTLLSKLSEEYQSNNNNIIENKKNTEEDIVHQALYILLKDLPIVCNHNEEYIRVKEIDEKITDNSLDITNIKVINSMLINAEKNLHVLPLYTSFVRGNLYKYLKKKGVKDHQIIIQCNIKKRQLYNYLSFYNLIMKYKSLLRINLSFTMIVKNITLIIKFIECDKEFKEFFKSSRPF